MYGDTKTAKDRMKGMKKRDKMQDMIPRGKSVAKALAKAKMSSSKAC